MSDIGWYLNLLLLAGGPIVTITLQTRTWIKTRIPDGFSPYVSAVVTFTHLLMMFWWLCERYERMLLYTSISIFSFQMVLIYIWVYIKGKQHAEKRTNVALEESFWYWNHFSTYLMVLVPVSVLLYLSTFFLQCNAYLTWGLGSLASGVDVSFFIFILVAADAVPTVDKKLLTQKYCWAVDDHGAALDVE